MDGASIVRSAVFALFLLFLAGCATLNTAKNIPPHRSLDQVPATSQQAIVVDPLHSSYARFTAWERTDAGWKQKFSSMRAMVGRNGIAVPDEKREGDGQTPSGVYPIGIAFGYASSFPTGLQYRQATVNDFWVDDMTSPQYNQWVAGKPDATSFELMRRKDDLYKYGAVIEYNTNPIVPGHGSAIFIHIWRAPGKPTSGCVALSPRSLQKLLGWLDARRDPVIILNWNITNI
jgi:L,D-peptidoglycan transpeptidase YkuD (ErfK/YbiS/YcfS/YnhG family)